MYISYKKKKKKKTYEDITIQNNKFTRDFCA